MISSKNYMESANKSSSCQEFWLATEDTLTIPFMEGYFENQVQPDYAYDQNVIEVIDRTTGEVVR